MTAEMLRRGSAAAVVSLMPLMLAAAGAPHLFGVVAADGPPQSGPQDEQTRASEAVAPGSDTVAYVPGTTLGTGSEYGIFRLGSLRLRPSLRTSYFYESNILTASTDRVSDRALFVDPGIEAHLPFGADGVRVSYGLSYRDYRHLELKERLSHFVDADSSIALTPIISLAVREHFSRTSLDSREFVPGREVFFSDAPFRRNDLDSKLQWSATENQSLGVRANWNSIRFVEPDAATDAPFYDYDVYRYGAIYHRDWTNRTSLFAVADYERVAADDPRGISSSRGVELAAGLTSVLTPLITTQLSVGFRRMRYPAAPLQNFNGLVYRCDLQKEFTESIRLSLAAFRGTYPSFWESNAFFKANGIGFTYSQDFGTTLRVSLRPGYQWNTYPLAGTAPALGAGRRDAIFDIYTGARYRITHWLAVEALYDFIRRTSNVPGLEFSDHRLGLSVIVGQEPVSRGRYYY